MSPGGTAGTDPGDMVDDADIRVEEIRDEMIRLGQLLKLASLVEDGGEAKALIEEGLVEVNGEVEQRRGRQLRHGDVVSAGGERVRVVTTPAP